MNLPQADVPTTFTKMRQVYWEAKQSFNKSLGEREDSCIISSDSELDIKLELLRNADNYFNDLLRALLDYRDALQNVVNTQDSLGLALIEFGTKDSTDAGKVMCISGRATCRAAQKQSQLKTPLMNLFHEVETFQFKATADALQTVAKMEKVRRSYRSGLMWLKKESTDLDPDVNKKMRNYRRVQEHIKRLKVRFDGVKLECMQKIDLFLLSRSNLFSHGVPPYIKTFKKICKHSVFCLEVSLRNTPLCLSYNFVAVKELNQYKNILQKSFRYQYPSERIFGKQNGKRKGFEKIRATVISDESQSTHSSNFKNSNNAEDLSSQTNCSGDTLLIDLSEEKRENLLQGKTLLEKCNLESSSKYSDDLLSIKLENYKLPFENNFSIENFENKIDYSVMDSVYIDPDTPGGEENLHFWSFIQSVNEVSTLTQRNVTEDKNMDSITSRQPSVVLSNSKWNDILVQFDPFLDNNPKLQNKTGTLELC